MQKISDAPAKQCPLCFENTAVRLVSAAGFHLKGTGWYATDFKNKGKKESKKEGVTSTEHKSADRKSADSQTPKTQTKGDKD